MRSINLNSRVARQVIQQEYGNNRNSLTRFVVGHAVIAKGVLYCEVSKGFREWNIFYSLSIVEKRQDGSTVRRPELSKLLNSMSQVFSEIAAMQEIF